MDPVLAYVEPRVSQQMNELLFGPYTVLEVKVVLQQMHQHKSPGLDGIYPFFFQKFWEVVGADASMLFLLF